uniref:Uncharacterized protein n=1 Tax=Strigamia maritima TaxID=126957 RepID=T1IR23_STRMM
YKLRSSSALPSHNRLYFLITPACRRCYECAIAVLTIFAPQKHQLFQFLYQKKHHDQVKDLKNHFYDTIWSFMPHDHPVFEFEQHMETTDTIANLFCRRRTHNQTHAMKQLWRRLGYEKRPSANLNNWFNDIHSAKKVNVFCFGGGMGCEIVGFYLWLKAIKTDAVFHCNIVEEFNWLRETEYLFRTIHPNLSVPNFYYHDFSEFLLDHMKSSAVLFFYDKIGHGFLEAIRHIAIMAGLEKINEIEDVILSVPNYEVKAMEENHFAIRPLKSIQICAALWQK